MDEHRLLDRTLGDRVGDDAWIDTLASTIFRGERGDAAGAVAEALAEGYSPEAVGEALSIAANRLVLHDPGRLERFASAEKPAGCVHGDSVGVHASDAANAWRHISRVGGPRNRVSALIVGAFHTAGQRSVVSDELYPFHERMEEVADAEPGSLLAMAEDAIVTNDQALASATLARYGHLKQPLRPALDLMLRYAVSEDGALHAEKYFHTVADEFHHTRPAYRWNQIVALARVTASEHGFPAPGYQQATELLGLG